MTTTDVRPLRGHVTPPGSKSITNRALVLGALAAADGTSVLSGPLDSDDTRDTAAIAEMLRATVTWGDDDARISPTKNRPANSGARIEGSATAVRLGLGALATMDSIHRAELSLSSQLSRRPLLGAGSEFGNALRALFNVEIGDLGDRIALERIGPVPDHDEMPVTYLRSDRSSQYVSSLLIAGGTLRRGLEIRILSPCDSVSTPYIEMTARAMGAFGVRADTSRLETDGVVVVEPGEYVPNKDLRIEPDASAASYPLVAGAVVPGSEITVSMVPPGDSWQGDSAIVNILREMGASVEWSGDIVTIRANGGLRGLGSWDMRDTPDLVQSVAVAASFAEGSTCIEGISFLADKETDRVVNTAIEIDKISGVVASVEDGCLMIYREAVQGDPSHGTVEVSSHGDHRMEMALSVAGRGTPGVHVVDEGYASKSWPGFHSAMDELVAV